MSHETPSIPWPTPAPYARQHDYAQWEAANPGVPPPGSYLNDEFASIQEAVHDTQDRLGLIQRDDGALRNGIVTVDSVEADFLDDLLTQAGASVALITAAANTATTAANTATTAAATATAAAEDAQEALAGVDAALTILDAFSEPAQIPVVGGEEDLDYLDPNVEVTAVELFKNGAMLFAPQDYSVTVIPGGVRFALVDAALVTDKFWVRNQRVYRPAVVGAEIDAVDARVTALEALNIESRLEGLEAQVVDALTPQLAALEAVVNAVVLPTLDDHTATLAAHAADIAALEVDSADHEARITALEAGATVTVLTADDTWTVGGGGADYATLTAAFDALALVRIAPGVRLELQLTGDTAEPGGLAWSHPQSGQIVLNVNGAARIVALGGFVTAVASKATLSTSIEVTAAESSGIAGGAYYPFWLPPEDTLVLAPVATGAHSLTIKSPAGNAPGPTSPMALLALQGRITRCPIAGAATGIIPKIVPVADTGCTPTHAFVADGAHFDAGGATTTSSTGTSVVFDFTSAVANTSTTLATFVNCLGALHIIGVGAMDAANTREKLVLAGGRLTIRAAHLTAAIAGGELDYIVHSDSAVDQNAFAVYAGGQFRLSAAAGVTISRRGTASGPMFFCTEPDSRMHLQGLTVDNEAAGFSGAGLASVSGGQLTARSCTLSNPPASGNKYAFYVQNGGLVRAVGMTYGGAFATNKSNATATWSSASGQTLTN